MIANPKRNSPHLLPLALLTLPVLAGCGGPDFGAGGRTNTFNNQLTGNYNGTSNGTGGANAGVRGRGTYPRLEAAFELGEIKGNPFDYTENDVIVTFSAPDNKQVRVPAFFDGDKTWRVRYTPDMQGRFLLTKVTLNGRDIVPDKLDKKEFSVTGTPQPGFIHRDTRDRLRFAYDNGATFLPLGHNLAYVDLKAVGSVTPKASPQAQTGGSVPPQTAPTNMNPQKPADNTRAGDAIKPDAMKSSEPAGSAGDVPALLDRMGRAGANWARVWMTYRDRKDLDWLPEGKLEPGALSLDVARRWDQILESAEKSTVSLQIVLQDHGQFSTRVHAQWERHPWNKKNGGWLGTPDEFFTDRRAIALTKAKYRYLIARYGWSPRLFAWELFDEVEATDSAYHKHLDEISEWHTAMAAFLHEQDPYKHLVTTGSSLTDKALWQGMDFYQFHATPAELAERLAEHDSRKLDKPLFCGQLGSIESDEKPTSYMPACWRGLVTETGGGIQPARWQAFEGENGYNEFKSLREFAARSGLASHRGLLPAPLTMDSGTGSGSAAEALTAFGKSGKDYAVLWVQRRQDDTKTDASQKVPPVSGSISISGFQSGSYKATWWDTRSGKVSSEQSIVVTGSSPLVLLTPAIADDAAVYVIRESKQDSTKKDKPKTTPKGEATVKKDTPALPTTDSKTAP